MKKVMITGAAGFIGYHLAQQLTNNGYDVIGMDSFNEYYGQDLKVDRKKRLKLDYNVDITWFNLLNAGSLDAYIKMNQPDAVVHLAAMAGVRHSLDNPHEYIDNNIKATQNLIDACEANDINDVVFASTSCVQDGNPLPWKESDPISGHQLNPYGYSKQVNECQFRMSKIARTSGARFFTVYGPYGRPDMALFKFSDAIVNGKEVDVYNYGNMLRDFTYVDDIVSGLETLLNTSLNAHESFNEIYNIGYGEQVLLTDFIKEIEKNFGRELKKNLTEKHPADTPETWSDTTKLRSLGWKPTTSIEEGVEKFVTWYKDYYKVN